MEKKNKSKQLVLSILGILSLIMITAGVTYAIFTYTKLGSTENTITVGTIKLLYTENTGVGKGIKITNALPISDDEGKAYSTDGYVFDFTVEGENSGDEVIPYEVTLRQKSDSTLDNKIVKVYFTKMSGGTETAVFEPTLFSALTQTTVDVGENVEKTLITEEVPAGATGASKYVQNYRLRMWIDEKADFSALTYYKHTSTGVTITAADYAALDDTAKASYAVVTHVNTSTNAMLTQAEYDALGDKTNVSAIADAPIYPYNGKTFTATVNVYSNVPTVSSTQVQG